MTEGRWPEIGLPPRRAHLIELETAIQDGECALPVGLRLWAVWQGHLVTHDGLQPPGWWVLPHQGLPAGYRVPEELAWEVKEALVRLAIVEVSGSDVASAGDPERRSW